MTEVVNDLSSSSLVEVRVLPFSFVIAFGKMSNSSTESVFVSVLSLLVLSVLSIGLISTNFRSKRAHRIYLLLLSIGLVLVSCSVGKL